MNRAWQLATTRGAEGLAGTWKTYIDIDIEI